MQRQLPTYIIEGTAFIVDVAKGELRQADKPANTIGFDEMRYKGTHYEFQYDVSQKNLPEGSSAMADIRFVEVPQLAELDPEGMAAKCDLPASEITGKRDFELLVDQELYLQRMSGRLPVIDIMGHPFYVDLRMDCVRPHDDFSTTGIELSEIEHQLLPEGDRYWLPYHPGSHSHREIDTATSLYPPKDVVIIEMPSAARLDPLGWARLNRLDIEDTLMRYPMQHDMKARIVDWKETGLDQVFEENRKRVELPGRNIPGKVAPKDIAKGDQYHGKRNKRSRGRKL